MENEIKPLLPQISRQKHGVITTLVSGFIGLAYEGISSFLQWKCENLVTAVKVLSTFNLTTGIIRNNCNFHFYYNKTDVTPTVLDGGDEIILVNWPNDKHVICNINNDIPVKILSHPYVLVNRSVLCNCRIEVDNHHLLESIASCDKKITKLIMYFTINLAFTNYLDMIPNLTDSLTLIRDRTHYEQPIPIHLNIPHYDSSLTNRPSKLKEFLHNYIHSTNNREIFDLQERHATHTFSHYKNFFLNRIVNISHLLL